MRYALALVDAAAVRRRVTAFLLALTVLRGGAAVAQTPSGQQSQEPAAPQFEEAIEVVGATPIPGIGVERDKIPGNIQAATAADLARTGIHAGEQLTAGFASVYANEAQTNPFQPDIQFRGFAASPLLGLPQGIAVYQDGVRMNEPFGDTVNWELLPTNAIASVTLMPGSNPLFGLNALGGAVSVQTKTGFSHPGHGVSVFGGSFGRLWADVAHRPDTPIVSAISSPAGYWTKTAGVISPRLASVRCSGTSSGAGRPRPSRRRLRGASTG